MLRADGRPVVLGAADADLLPEPLLGEGVDLDLDPAELDAPSGPIEHRDLAPAMAAGGDDQLDTDDDRGSLLRFLSTTKP